MKVRAAVSLLLSILAAPLFAQTSYDLKVLVDADNNRATGCTVVTSAGNFDGVDQVVTTKVDLNGTVATVRGVTRQICADPGSSLLGTAIPVNTLNWPGLFDSNRILTVETGIPFSDLTNNSGGQLRMAFTASAGSLSDAVIKDENRAIMFPGNPGRRRPTRPISGQMGRTITLDGNIADWDGLEPMSDEGSGTQALRILSVTGYLNDRLYFLFRLSANADAPKAIDDSYQANAGSALNVVAPGVLSNDIDPKGKPLTAILVSGPEHGTVTLAPDGSFSYLNDGSNNAGDAFRYKASNGTFQSNTANVNLSVPQAPSGGGGPKAPVFLSPNNAAFQVGQFGGFAVVTLGNPVATLSMTGALPTGVTFTPVPGTGSGPLLGTPAAGTGGSYPLIFTATNGVGAPVVQNFTLTVNQPPAITSANAATFTVGTLGSFIVTVTGFPAPAVSVTGALPSGVTFNPATRTLSGTPALGSGGTYPLVFTAANGVGVPAVQPFTLTVNETPRITTAAVDVTICTGGTVNFSAIAAGFPAPGVQWQVSTNGGATFSNIPGATSTSLSFVANAALNANKYQAVFTNLVGTISTTATLTVNVPPNVTTNPVNQTICAGASVSFTAAATATPAATVQWQVSTNGGGTFANIPGATSTTLTFVTAANQTGNQYHAVFTNACGSSTTTNAILTVNTAPAVTAQPADVTVCAGGTASFTSTASSIPAATVQWQVSTDNGVNWSNIGGATSTTYSFPTVAGDNGKKFRAVFTNSCGVTNSNAASLRVDTLPVVTTNPLTQTICAGATVTFISAANSNAGQTVQWQLSTDGGVNFSNIGGATSTSYSFVAAAGDNTRQYRATFTNSCGTATTTAATLTVDTLPSVNAQPANVTVCTGASASFTSTATSNAGDHTVQWQLSTDGGVNWSNIGGATSTTYSFSTVAADNTHQFRAVFTDACGNTNSNAATLTVNTPPVVTTNPLIQTICAGSNVTFTAAASGQPTPTVQWQLSIDGGVNFSDIGGATSTSYSFTTAVSDNGHQFRARFTNACGSNVATSAATLTVNVAPAVTSQPSSATFCATTTASFTATASGTPTPTVQWQLSTDGGVNFSNIGGATSTTYNFTAQASDNGHQYRAVFTNSCGTATSNAATITVTVAPAMTAQPANTTVCDNTTASFTATASGTPTPTVQWQLSTDAGANWSNIGGATSTTYSFTAFAADSGKQYRAVFTNSCGTATSNAAILTVNTPPAVTTNPVTQSACTGQSVSFTAAASGTPSPTVQWQISTDGGVNWSNIGGATSTTYSFTAAQSDDGHQYRAVFTNSCSTATTTAATLTINVTPAVTTDPTNQTVCAGATASFTAAGTGSPTPTVQWQLSTDGGANWSNIGGATSTTYSFSTVAGDNNHQFRAVFTNLCSSATSAAATLRVDTLPVVNTHPLTQTVCAGGTASFTAAATSNAGQTVQWQVSTDGGANYTNIGGATSTTLSFTTTAGQNGNKYHAVFTNSCGTATTNAATLTVDTIPVVNVQPSPQTVCAGASASFTSTATSNASDHTVQWQKSTDGGVNWSNVGGATSTTYSFTTSALDNGNQYRAVFTDACGSTNSNAAALTVNTAPAVTTNPSNSTVCENTTASFTVAASASPAPTVQWQLSTDGGVNFSDIGGATTTTYSFTAVAADNTHKYRAVFTNICGTATTTAATLTVNTAPVVTTHPLTQSVQSGTIASFTAAASGTPSPTVQWQISTDSGVNFTDIGGATNTTYSFTAALSDSGHQFRARFSNACATNVASNAATLTVTCPTITVSRNGGGTFPAATYNVSYTGESVTASGGTGPYTFAVTSGALPTGMNPLASNGAISGTPTATGTFNFTVTATDTSSNCTGSQSFSLAVNPSAAADSYNNLVNNSQAVVTGGLSVDPGPNTLASGRARTSLSGTITANDAPSGGIILTTGAFATSQGGSVTIASDGTFLYTPPVASAASPLSSDTFTYTISSNTGGTATPTQATGTVTLNLANRVWYVDNTNAGTADGRSNTPFTTLAAAQAASFTSDYIYVYKGSGSTGQNAGIILKNSQIFLGQGSSLIVNGGNVMKNGTGNNTGPTITNTAGNAVTLADGNTVKGMTINGASGDGISGNGKNGVTLDFMTLASNAGSGVHLVNMTGTVTSTNSSWTDKAATPGSIVLDISGGSGPISFDRSNTLTSSSGRTLSIAARTGGTITIGADINDNGSGILINNSAAGSPIINFHEAVVGPAVETLNTGANTALTIQGSTGTPTISFPDTLTITTTTGIGFSASGAGNTLNVTGAANITTGAAANALNLNGVTVGASGVTFNNITSTGAATALALTNVTGLVSINGGTITNGAATTGVSLQGGSTSLTLSNTTITGGSGATVGITNTTNFGTLTLSSDNISAGTGISLTGGTLAGTSNVVSATGQGLILNTVAITAGTTFSTVDSAGGADGISLTSVSGSPLTISAGTLTNNTSAGFFISGGSSNITFGGGITSAGASFLVDITGRSGGTVTFATGTLGGAGTLAGNGIRIQNSTGTSTFTFSGTQTLGTNVTRMANTAVTLAGNNTNTTFNFSGTMSIFTGAVTAFTATGPAGGTINFSGSDSIDSGASALVLNGVNLGAGTLSSVTSAGGTNGISLTTVTGGTLTISGGALSGATGATFLVSGGTVSVTDAGTISQATASQPVVSVGGSHTGTLNLNGAVTATNGTGLSLISANGTYNIDTGSNAMSLNGGDSRIILSTSSGTFTFGSVAAPAAITNPVNDAFAFDNSNANVTYNGNITKSGASAFNIVTLVNQTGGTVTFQNGTLSSTSTAATGISLNNADGTVNFSGTTTLNGGDAGVDITNGSGGTFTFSASASINNPTGIAYNEDTSTANVTFGGPITKTNNGNNAVNINAKTGGTTTFNGSITASTTTANAIDLTNTGGTVSFTGGMGLTTTSGIAFNTTGGGVVNISGTNNINSTSGKGLNWATATSASTVTFNNVTSSTGAAVTIASSSATDFTFNDVTSGTGTAVTVTTASGDFIFHAINATGATKGITVTSATGTFTVNGTGSTTASGGTVQNCTTRGAEFVSSNNVTLKNMNFIGNGTAGAGTVNSLCGDALNQSATAIGSLPANCQANIYLQSATTVNLNNVKANSSKEHGIWANDVNGLTLTNIEAQLNGDEVMEDGVQLVNQKGTVTVTGGIFRDNAARSFEIQNNSGTPTLNITGGTFGNTTSPTGATTPSTSTAADTILLATNGSSGASITSVIKGATFANIFGRAINVNTEGSTSQNVSFGLAGAGNGNIVSNVSYGTDINGTTSGSVTYSIVNNTFTNTSGAVTSGSRTVINARKGFGATGNWSGTVSNNVIGTVGVTDSGCDAVTCGGISLDNIAISGNHDILVTNNTIRRVNGDGIFVANNPGQSSTGTVRTTIMGNTLEDPEDGTSGAGGNQGNAVNVTTGGAGASLNAKVESNSATGNWRTVSGQTIRGVRFIRGADSIFCVSGYSGPFDSASVGNYITSKNTGNAGSATQSLIDSPPRQFTGPGCPTP